MMFVEFTGANMRETDEGREYTERGPIGINPAMVSGYYDHTILLGSNHKVRVMESIEEIRLRLEMTREVLISRG